VNLGCNPNTFETDFALTNLRSRQEYKNLLATKPLTAASPTPAAPPTVRLVDPVKD
jgi:hypothetical protein